MNIWEGVTVGQMCDVIAYSKILTNKKGENPTSIQIFNYSPSGELFDIWDWYASALIILEIHTEEEVIECYKNDNNTLENPLVNRIFQKRRT